MQDGSEKNLKLLKKNLKVVDVYKKYISLHAHFLFMITDLKYLQQMTGNDSQIMKEMIELFLNQLDEMHVEIESLLNDKKWFELSRMAHKIKSSALVMGAEQMSNDMKELELLAKESKNTEKYPEYIARFNSMIGSVEKELRPYLDSCK